MSLRASEPVVDDDSSDDDEDSDQWMHAWEHQNAHILASDPLPHPYRTVNFAVRSIISCAMGKLLH
jgi:hypothetical protein